MPAPRPTARSPNATQRWHGRRSWQRTAESIINQFKVLSAETAAHQAKQGDAVAEQRLKATEQLMVPVKESLERFNNRLTEVEKERAAISTDLRNQVAEVKLTGEALRRETAALVTALRKPQVRGAWGELQLKRVAEISGMLEYCDFVQQETTQTSSGAIIRPDMKVTLAEGKFVYVDSKVPLSAFLDAHEANSDADRERYLGLFAKNVQSHIDQLSRKDYYKADPSSPEFVVLFLRQRGAGRRGPQPAARPARLRRPARTSSSPPRPR